MKKLKTIFSPRKLIVWMFLILLIFTVPELSKPSMSQTEAIVTMMCVDKKDEEIEIALAVMTPSQTNNSYYQVYTGSGSSVAEAVDKLSQLLGKEIGFAQCEIMAFGENVCEDGIMPTLDYMTRTKKVGRNAILINFVGDSKEFTQLASNVNLEKSIKLSDVLNYDKRYLPAKESNIDAFYKDYFSKTSTGLIPQIKVQNNADRNSLEVATQNSGFSQETQSGVKGSEKYFVNDGTTSVFKYGKKVLEIGPDMIKKVNYFINKDQQGVINVNNVTDELFNNANVVFSIDKKKIYFHPKFEDGKPIFKFDIDLTVLIEEVQQDRPTEEFLRRNKEFLTEELINRLTEQIKDEMLEAIEFCKDNKVDLLKIYQYYNAFCNNDFKDYYEQTKEKYLDDIDYQISVKVSTAY